MGDSFATISSSDYGNCSPNGERWPSWQHNLSPFDRTLYVEELTHLLYDQLTAISIQLDGYDPSALVPANSDDVTYNYPDFSAFDALKPPPFVGEYHAPDSPEEHRPTFLEIDEPSKPNIPPWTLGDLAINLEDFPDPKDFIIDFAGEPPPTPIVPMPPPMAVRPDPVLGGMLPVTIPPYEDVQFPIFDATLEDINLVEPSILIDVGDNDYSSPLLDATQAKLFHDVVHGGTGLDPVVEDAIWQRESERALQAHNDRLIKLKSDWSKGHFPLPNSMFFSMISEAEMDYTNKRLDTSRDISIKQAELAQTNTHFAIEKAIAWDQMMINWTNSIAGRVFEASKATAEFSLDIYKTSIQKYNVLVDVYKAKVQLYETTASIALKRIEAFRVRMEAAKITSEINKTVVEVYKAEVDALMTFINKYRAELEASKTYLEIEQLKIQAYKTEVEAYGIRVNASTANYNMYNIRNEGEKTRVSAYSAGSDAYGKRVQAVKVGVDAETAYINAQADINKSYASVYESDIKSFAAQVQGEVENIASKVKVYETQQKGYETEAKVLDIIGTLELKSIDTQLQEYKIEFEAGLESMKLQVQQTLEKWKLRFNVLETMSQVIAQVTSAALNSDSQTTHLSEGYSYGEQTQISCNTQYYYDETEV